MPRLFRARRRRVARKGRKMRKMRRNRISKTLNSMNDRARVVEVENYGDLTANVGQNLTWMLNRFPRALAVSRSYRYYRCTKVELQFIPYANIFAPGQSLPELYYQTDYTTAVSQVAPTQASMEGRGVLPVKWNYPIKRYINPAVLRHENLEVQKTADVLDVQPVTSTPVKYKWYMTQQTYTATQAMSTAQTGPSLDPTNLKYYGAAFLPSSPNTPGVLGRLVVKVHWEFKQPLVVPGSSAPQAN